MAVAQITAPLRLTFAGKKYAIATVGCDIKAKQWQPVKGATLPVKISFDKSPALAYLPSSRYETSDRNSSIAGNETAAY